MSIKIKSPMKILSNPTHQSQKGYSSFPMRQRKCFSSTIGHLLPIYYDYLQPGDKVTCGAEVFSRFQPMVSPLLNGDDAIEEHIDWFFVPLDQIYSYFGDAFFGIQDFKNDFVGASTPRNSQIFPQFSNSVIGNLFTEFRLENGEVGDEIFNADNCVIFRLLDCLGYPVRNMFRNFFYSYENGNPNSLFFRQNINIWFAAAYQKIWSDHYRLDDWQENDSFLYNFDSFIKSDTSRSDYQRFRRVFTLHRAPYKRDYFTYVLPTPIFNTSAYNSLGDDSIFGVNQWLSNISALAGYTPVNAGGTGTTSVTTGIIPNNANNAGQVNNPATLRTMFAMEKALEVTRRAGKHYDSQVLAHFGIHVPSGLSGESTFIGGQTIGAQMQDVFSTAATTNQDSDGNDVYTPLGDMAGKGVLYGKKGGISYEAKCHGVLMAIFYVVPNIIYEQSGIDRLNSYLRPQDFPHPELDDLGMQPLFGYEIFLPPLLNNQVGSSQILAWKYRYSELKSKYNVAFGNLMGDMRPWILGRENVLQNGLFNWSSLTIDTTLLNSLMLVKYTGNVPASDAIPDLSEYSGNLTQDYIKYGDYVYNQIYARDPLLHDVRIFVNKASKMSVYGLPSL